MFSISAQREWVTKDALCYEDSCFSSGMATLNTRTTMISLWASPCFLQFARIPSSKQYEAVLRSALQLSLEVWLPAAHHLHLEGQTHTNTSTALLALSWLHFSRGRDEVAVKPFISYVRHLARIF